MTTSASPAALHALTADDLRSFHERGWVLKRGLFAPELMRRLGAEMDGLHERMHRHTPPDVHIGWEEKLPEGAAPRILQLMNSERVSPILDAMSRSEEILAPMRELIGPDVYLFHSKLLMKAAHVGAAIPWHQDWGYWQYGCLQPTQVNCQLAIDATDRGNGALRFVDGSHRNGPVDHAHLQRATFGIGIDEDIEGRASTLVEMAPGDAVFFGCMVIHGSGPNRSPRDRRANTFAYDKPRNQKKGEMPDAYWRCGERV